MKQGANKSLQNIDMSLQNHPKHIVIGQTIINLAGGILQEVDGASIRTTGLAGGLFTPYKGSLPALESKDSSKGSPAATSFTQGAS